MEFFPSVWHAPLVHDEDHELPAPAANSEPRRLGGRYWRLWASSGLSNLGDGVLQVALPLVAIQFTRSPTLIAGLPFALTLPWLLFALPAGALADRLDRRKAMLGANGVRAAVLAVLVLAVVLELGSIWALYVAAFALGVAETLYDTAAQSILPQMVRREQLSRANGYLQAAERTNNEFIGPPLAGFLVAVGVAVAVAVPAALWAVAVLALMLVRGRFRVERTRGTSLRVDIAEGLRFLWRHRLLRTLAAMTGGMNFTVHAMMAILVLYAVGPSSAVGLSESGYGVLLACTAAGSVVGSFLAERVERLLGRARSLGFTVVASAVFVGVPAVTADPIGIGAGFFVGGAGIVVWNVIAVSLRQRVTPDRLLGRLNSAYRLVGLGTMPLGFATGGVLAEAFGLRTVFVVMAIMTLGLLAGMTIVTDTAMASAERAGEHR